MSREEIAELFIQVRGSILSNWIPSKNEVDWEGMVMHEFVEQLTERLVSENPNTDTKQIREIVMACWAIFSSIKSN